MPVQLTHIGEDLIAAMLASLATRQELSRVTCAMTGRSLADDIDELGIGGSLGFRADDALLVVQNGEIGYACDGEQTVDVLCTGTEHAIAFEAKLGETRMSVSEFGERFCGDCVVAKHPDPRLRGSMVAVLERSLPFPPPSQLIAQIDNSRWTLAKPWWLVLRQNVFDNWHKATQPPVPAQRRKSATASGKQRKTKLLPVSNARILVFDALAAIYGSRQQFDQLVQRVVGSDFAGRWRLSLSDP